MPGAEAGTERGKTRRGGAETRARIRSAALQLFTERGFEGTSIKDLADALGMTKSALYHHFPNKDAIVVSLFEERQRDIDELVDWANAQLPGPQRLADTALRWASGLTPDTIRGMRFARTNLPVMRRLGTAGRVSPFGFDRVIDAVVGAHAPPATRLWASVVFEAGAAAVNAADGLGATDDDVLRTAQDVVRRLVDLDPAPGSDRSPAAP